jgi:hypothetical protein
MVELQPVESSNIAAVGYDEDAEVLYIEFKSGTTYTYEDVPYYIYEELLGAESIGSYFHKNIRTTYEYNKVN